MTIAPELPIKEFDVLICGAGPAGCTAALALANTGLRVAVIEKSTYPRDKICGDAVAAYVPKVLATINPQFSKALSTFEEKVLVNTCRLVAPNEKIFDVTYQQTGFISKRIEWDHFLFQLAAQQKNITIFLSHPISDVAISSVTQEVTVTTPHTLFKGKIVIGCDGAHSVVNKKITGTRPDMDHYSGAVRAYYKNVSGLTANTFELHFIKDLLPGYFWIFPVKDNMANVGLGVLSSVVSKRRMDLRKYLQKVVEEVPYVRDRFTNADIVGKIEGFGLPLGSRKVPISGDHFMLCGDAASLIDPLSGEGIGQAMVSGRYAGWQAKKCFDENNFSASLIKQYDHQVYAKFWKRHRKNYAIQRIIADRDWLVNGIFNAANKNSFVRKMITKAIV